MHEHFLDTLAKCFIPKTEVIIITDAGFQGHGFRLIRSRGWIFLCRVLGAQYHSINGEWEKVKDINSKASLTPSYLGQGLLGRDKNARYQGYFYLYKSKPKGQKFKRAKDKAARAMVTKKARCAGKSPWLTFTNTTEFSPKQIMKLYSRRMQIEQNFRYFRCIQCLPDHTAYSK